MFKYMLYTYIYYLSNLVLDSPDDERAKHANERWG